MKYFFLKKVDNVSVFFDKFYVLNFHNNVLNLNYKFLFNKNLLLVKKNTINSFCFKYFINRTKFINLLRKSFLNVTRGFCLHLDLIGLGYSVTVKNKIGILRLNIGYNHSIFYKIPFNVVIRSKRKRIYLFCYSFFLLKNLAEEIKNFRRLSIYKLKGIKVKNELYVKKN